MKVSDFFVSFPTQENRGGSDIIICLSQLVWVLVGKNPTWVLLWEIFTKPLQAEGEKVSLLL